MVICLERDANNLHMVQLMPVPPHHFLLHKKPEWLSFWYRLIQEAPPALGALPSVLWRCWLGGKKSIRPIKMSDDLLEWLSVWSEVQMTCIWSSCSHCDPVICTSAKSRVVYPSGTGLPRLSWKNGHQMSVVVILAYPDCYGKRLVNELLCLCCCNESLKYNTVWHG